MDSAADNPLRGSPDDLFRVVYDEMRRVAQKHMERQPAGHTLQPTALVNETFLRLCKGDEAARPGAQVEFIRLASRVMRTILVDHARGKRADKRTPPGRRIDLDGITELLESRSADLVEVDAALHKLAERDRELAELVELHFFGGQPLVQCAEVFGVGERQIQRRLRVAKLFLRRELGDD